MKLFRVPFFALRRIDLIYSCESGIETQTWNNSSY
jgi:hypothetical protein